MKKIMIGEMSWIEANERIRESRAVILPLGSTEQHGPHMSLATDTTVASYVSKVLGELTDCVVLPTLPFGQVWSAKDFPGTMSLKERTFIEVVKDVVISLEKGGARNVILFSGHLGNNLPSKTAARELLDEFGYKNVFHISYTDIKKHSLGIMDTDPWNGKTFHAAELETSILLHIAPDGVDMSKAVREYPLVPGDIEIRPIPWKDFSSTGVFGDAIPSTAEKGKRFLDNWINDMVEIIEKNVKY